LSQADAATEETERFPEEFAVLRQGGSAVFLEFGKIRGTLALFQSRRVRETT
jgi:hypothetical protein